MLSFLAPIFKHTFLTRVYLLLPLDYSKKGIFYKKIFSLNEMLNDLNKVAKSIVSVDMQEQIERSLIHSMQSKEEISISYYRDGIIHDMYISVSHIEPLIKTVYCTDAFGLSTEFKFDELVNIN
ncbi:3-oxoacyl-ACP synthase [Bacillus cereus]|nr:3-oxoacyl-ACP synthase [Bacillus cereus]